MNPILNNIDFIARSPGGVTLLRKLILELAVRGKLVPQDPRDEPASVLLERIKREKARLVKEGKIKAGKELPEIKEEEKPYELPKGWEWVRLGEIGQITGGGTPKTDVADYWSDGEGIPWLTPADLYGFNAINISIGKRSITKKGLEESSAQLLPPGTVLFSSRAPIGYVAIAQNLLATNQGFKSCTPFILEINRYLYYFLKARASEIDSSASGTTFKELSGKEMSVIIVPLPPLPEQSRIVARVQELMAVLDRLEDQTNKTEEERNRALIAATQAVSQAATPEEIASSWLRLATNLDRLVDRAEDVKTIRAMVLELAVRGKLVPQDPKDEPASVLLERIKREKARLVKEGKIKAGKELPEIKEEEKPFELPRRWIWARLGEYCDVRDGTHDTPKYTMTGYPLVTSKNIYQGILDLRNVNYISQEDYRLISQRSQVDEGDILFAMIGSIGNPVIISTSEEFAIKNVALFKRYAKSIPNLMYLHTFLSASSKIMKESSSGGVQNFVSLTFLREYLIPLPPLSEQSRILARVQELMAILDRLEEKLAARDKAAALASESIIKMNQA